MRIIIALLILLFTFIHNRVYADDGYFELYPQSGTVMPLENKDIKMVSEEVIYKGGQFTAEFEFLNTSNNEKEVTIGFPVIGSFAGFADSSNITDDGEVIDPRSETVRQEDIKKYYNFKSFIDGKEVERVLIKLSRQVPNENYDYVFGTKLKFSPLQKIIVRNVYNQSKERGGTSTGDWEQTISYILTTGALWKDKIENARIVFYMNTNWWDTYNFEPGRYGYGPVFWKYYFTSSINFSKVSDNGIYEWNFKDWEPKDNLYVSYGWRAVSLPINSNELLNDINMLTVENLNKKYKEFFAEMQIKETFQSCIIALTECKLFVPTENLTTYGSIEDAKANAEQDQRQINARFLINSLYALKGYKFNKPEWANFFKQFKWYNPETDNPAFSPEEKDLIAKLSKLEGKETK